MTNKKFAFIERSIRRSLNETNEINRVETEQDAFDMVDAAIDEHQRSKLYKAVNAKSSYAFDKLYLMSDRLGAEHQHFAVTYLMVMSQTRKTLCKIILIIFWRLMNLRSFGTEMAMIFCLILR